MNPDTSKFNFSVPGPENIQRFTLDNGIILLTRENYSSPTVAIHGYLNCGSFLDPPNKSGLAFFTSLGLMRGTKNRNFLKIYAALETIGASLGFASSVHHTSFSGKALVEDFAELVNIMADCILNPVFPTVQIENLRSQLIGNLHQREMDTGERASLKFDELLFPGHPYGIPEDGTLETLANITPHDLQAFHHNYYSPQGMVIVVVGALNEKRIRETFEATLGSWNKPANENRFDFTLPLPPAEGIQEKIYIQGKSQTDIIMGTRGPKRNSPDYFAASLGNNILGQMGLMGRIGTTIREKSGLAYYAYASLNSWIASGSWEFSAGVNRENLDAVINIILQEVNRFIAEPVTEEELVDCQSNFIGKLPLSFESNHGMASAILKLERFNLGLDYFQVYPDEVMKITSYDILETARKYLFPEKFIIVSAGS